MIVPPALRPRPNLLRAASRAARCFSQTAAPRGAHQMPVLKNDAQLREEGIPGLYTAEGIAIAWTEYHGMLLEKLSEFTAGTEEEGMEPEKLLVKFARDPTNAHKFNYASMAFNNHFFFKGISRTPVPIPQELSASLTNDFGSIETLRSEFLATANSMFGPGFVWLVQIKPNNYTSAFRILPTYIAGSPFAGAHYRRQPVDMNTQNPESAASFNPADSSTYGKPTNSVGAMGNHSENYAKRPKVAYGGIEVTPLLCVSTWEHSWLRDWRIIKAKEGFLAAWWDRIDWDVVSRLVGRPQTRYMTGQRTNGALRYNQ